MIKECHQHIHHDHPDKSDVAVYSINLGHHTELEDTNILSTKFRNAAGRKMSIIPI
jgi:hypothetical protein